MRRGTGTRPRSRFSSEEEVLFRRTGGIYLRVADDGGGMREGEPGSSPRQLALKAMRERTELFGGWFHLLSAPGSGTIVECWVPEAALVGIAADPPQRPPHVMSAHRGSPQGDGR
jgi:signal transduction histidine kinase